MIRPQYGRIFSQNGGVFDEDFKNRTDTKPEYDESHFG